MSNIVIGFLSNDAQFNYDLMILMTGEWFDWDFLTPGDRSPDLIISGQPGDIVIKMPDGKIKVFSSNEKEI